MLVAQKRKLSMVGSENTAWQPTEPQPQRPKLCMRLSRDGQKLRRVPSRSLPSDRAKQKMPTDQIGECCKAADGQPGVKKWGDGKGSEVFGERTYICHMCMYELPKPPHVLLGFASHEDMLSVIENGEPLPAARTQSARSAHPYHTARAALCASFLITCPRHVPMRAHGNVQ